MGLYEDLVKLDDIDARVRARLAHSLAHILDRAEDYLDVDASRLETALGQIRNTRQNPGVFARYYDLIFAIRSNRFTEANQLLTEIADLAGQPIEFAILPLEREHLGDDYDRFARLLFAEYTGVNPMASPTGATHRAYAQKLRDAMDIIARVDKSIHDEITALLVRIYITVSSKDRSARSFAGVTSFMVWGASFINVEVYQTRWEAVQFLVHEITHGLLFGLSCDEPLILNSPSENYPSPLRTELRPMEGLYHAMMVCARMATFNRMWMDSGLVPPEDRGAVDERTAGLINHFQEGVVTINQHGKLSEQARHLFDNTCRALSVAA